MSTYNQFMNIKRHPNNPYVDVISFPAAKGSQVRRIQEQKLLEQIMAIAKNEFLNPEGKVYTKVRNDMGSNPKAYPVSRDVLDGSITKIFNACSKIISASKQNVYDDELFRYGFSTLSEKFYEDVASGQINKKFYADAVSKMGYSFQKFLTCNKIDTKTK